MTLYRTGRSGSVTYSGTIGGLWAVDQNLDHGMPEYAMRYISFRVQAAGALVRGNLTRIFDPASDWELEAAALSPVLTDVTWDAGISSDVDTVTPSGSFPISVNMAGSWSVEIDVEEVFELGGSGFSSYGGAACDDWPENRTISFSLRTLIGGRMTISVTSGGGSASIAGTINTLFPVNAAIHAELSAFAKSSYGEIVSNSSSLTNTISFGGTAGFEGSFTHTGTDFLGTVSGGTMSAQVQHNPGSVGPTSYVNTREELVSCDLWATRTANMECSIRALDTSYPDALGVRYRGYPGVGYVDSGASQTITQRKYEIVCSYRDANGPTTFDTDSVTVDQFAGVSCHLRPGTLGDGDTGSLLHFGEDPRLWRCLQRGFYRDGATVQQASDLTFSTGSDVASGPASTIRRSFSDYSGAFAGKSLNGYRFLRFALTADHADEPARITIGSKYWDVTVQTSGNVDIDLCSPTNASVNTDSTDTKWPEPSEWGQLSGVNHCSEIVIDHLASGRTYTLGNITLHRASTVKLQMLPEFQNWILRETPVTVGAVTSTTSVRRYMLGDTDGKQSLELEDVGKTELSSGSTSYGAVSIAQMVNALTAAPGYPSDGWSATDHAVAPGGCAGDPQDLECYLNSDRDLMYLAGGGATHDDTAWSYWQNKDLTSALDMPMQMLFDSVEDWYGGIGDVFGFGGLTDALEMRAAVFLRGKSWGTVVGNDLAPIPGSTVELQLHSDHSAAGSGTTDTQGRYETGTPFGKGLLEYDTIAAAGSGDSTGFAYETSETNRHYRIAGGSDRTIRRTFASRKYHRAAFKVGQVGLQVAQNLLPLAWSSTATDISGGDPCLQIERFSREQRLWISYIGTGDVGLLVYTVDEGTTISMPATIARGVAHLRFVLTRHGTMHFIWRDTGDGKLKGKITNSQVTTLVDTFVIVGADVDDAAIDVRDFLGANGEHRIGIGYRSMGDLVFISATNGVDFS